jgi:hypothetical protein
MNSTGEKSVEQKTKNINFKNQETEILKKSENWRGRSRDCLSGGTKWGVTVTSTVSLTLESDTSDLRALYILPRIVVHIPGEN